MDITLSDTKKIKVDSIHLERKVADFHWADKDPAYNGACCFELSETAIEEIKTILATEVKKEADKALVSKEAIKDVVK